MTDDEIIDKSIKTLLGYNNILKADYDKALILLLRDIRNELRRINDKQEIS